MDEKLIEKGQFIQLTRLSFDDLRKISVGEVLYIQFPATYSIQKARNIASLYKNYYKDDHSFSINDMGGGKCKLIKK